MVVLGNFFLVVSSGLIWYFSLIVKIIKMKKQSVESSATDFDDFLKSDVDLSQLLNTNEVNISLGSTKSFPLKFEETLELQNMEKGELICKYSEMKYIAK